MGDADIEARCKTLRANIEELKRVTVELLHVNSEEFKKKDYLLDGPNLPGTRNSNIMANVACAFHHLEDARMRLGKVMQACQGGRSILDE